MTENLLPGLVLLEVFYLAFAGAGVIRWAFLKKFMEPARQDDECFLVVSCVITCYSEGAGVQRTIQSLLEQDYPGLIEIILVVDGAALNEATLLAAMDMQQRPWPTGRSINVLPKWQRGGRASSLNAGLAVASGEIVMSLDGDTSFDRDMVWQAASRFRDENLLALAGTLRVRNAEVNVLTRLQSLDYLLFRQFVRTGLGAFKLVNNIPGAHGIFRTRFIRMVGGWDTGSAEDVDIAFRIKKYFGRYPDGHMSADPHVISHTDVPEKWTDFLRQRLRWEGDPFYLYFRKHLRSLRPSIMGWPNFAFAVWYGVIYQIAIPLLMLISVIYLFAFVDPGRVIEVLVTSYAIYLLAFLLVFCSHLGVVSERMRTDAALWMLLPVYPLYVLVVRLWSAAAVLHSLLLRSHLDSSMAPWWVLKKGKF